MPGIVGYYDWDGEPCRLIAGAPEEDPVAEIFAPGIGFRPTSLAGMLLEAVAVSPEAYAELIRDAEMLAAGDAE